MMSSVRNCQHSHYLIICVCPPGPPCAPCVTIPVTTNALKTEGVSMEVSHFRHKIDLVFFRFVVCFQIQSLLQHPHNSQKLSKLILSCTQFIATLMLALAIKNEAEALSLWQKLQLYSTHTLHTLRLEIFHLLNCF